MTVEILDKQSFSVIGKLGQGNSNQGSTWVPPLWEAANGNFGEIEKLAKRDESGNIVGIWGAMSNIDDSFNRWSSQGKYLAGCEVIDGATAPEGWTKWIIPSYKFLVVKCNQESYEYIFNHMINEYMPEHHYKLAGAVHEFFQPQENDGGLYLYFPIEKL